MAAATQVGATLRHLVVQSYYTKEKRADLPFPPCLQMTNSTSQKAPRLGECLVAR